MPDRPYTLLSCGMSIDGYLGSATPRRLALSNDADFDRVDAVRAACDAILVGAGTVRNDNPRLLVRSQTRRDERTARGLAPSPIKVTVTERVELDACADFFTTGDTEKLVYCASPRGGRRPLAARAGGDRGRRRPAGGDAQDQRGPRRPRRAAADGRGRRQGAHAVPDRRPRRRAAAGRRAVLRRRLAGPAVRRATAASPGTPTGARRSPRCARSATWCCCATRSRRGSGPTDRGDRCRCDCPPRRSAPRCRCRCGSPTGTPRPPGCSASTGWSTARSTSPSGWAIGPPRVTSGATRAGAAGPAAQRVPHRRRVRQPALRLRRRSCARPSSASPTPAATCCTCGRRGAASACTPSSTPTRCRTRGWTPTRRTSRSATARTSADYTRRRADAAGAGRVAGRAAQQQPGQGPAARAGFGVTVAERVPTGVHLSAANARYLATKARRGAHTLDLPLSAG